MVALVAREGRQRQRYNSHGGRLVVGCIPYRIKSWDEEIDQGVEVLVISSQKGQSMMFPKGGWEADESIDEAALREAMEEAGVGGKVEEMLGKWDYKSKRYGTLYEGYMFPLNVTQEVDCFPEMQVRKKKWVKVAEAREGCRDLWMRQALEVFILRLSRGCKYTASTDVACSFEELLNMSDRTQFVHNNTARQRRSNLHCNVASDVQSED